MDTLFTSEQIEERIRNVKDTLHCPHCDVALEKWRVPDAPFVEWSSEYQYICFNDECPYFQDGWSVMASQRNACSYRFMYDPASGGCHPIPVLSEDALRESIVHAK